MKIRRRNFIAATSGIAAGSYLPITSELAQAQATRTLIVAEKGTPEGLDGDALKGNTQSLHKCHSISCHIKHS